MSVSELLLVQRHEASQTAVTLPAPHPSNTPVEKHPLRLQLSASIGRGALDGAWWPYSRDLAIEAVDLVDHFPAGFDRICHVAHSTQDGDAGRRKHRHQRLRQARFVPARRHPPRYLGRGVSANSGQVLQLLVVPSDWDAGRPTCHANRRHPNQSPSPPRPSCWSLKIRTGQVCYCTGTTTAERLALSQLRRGSCAPWPARLRRDGSAQARRELPSNRGTAPTVRREGPLARFGQTS